MTDDLLRKQVIDRLKQKGITQHSQRFIRAADVVSLMKLEPEQKIKAQTIAREWVS